jgi:hypothetical protein
MCTAKGNRLRLMRSSRGVSDREEPPRRGPASQSRATPSLSLHARGIEVHEVGEVYELQAVVARAAVVRDAPEVPLKAWSRNRASQLVGK